MSDSKPRILPTSQVLRPEPVRARLGPEGYRVFAEEFLVAAKHLVSRRKERPSPVAFFLLCKSVELALKAYLLGCRVSTKKLKAGYLGHDIERLLTEAEAFGLSDWVSLTQEQKMAIIHARAYYTERVFDYFQAKVMIAPFGFPNAGHLEAAASGLLSQLASFCMDASDPDARPSRRPRHN